jgi:cysteine desulfurase
VEGEAVMINLDLKGIAVATGSTCALGGTEVSPSLLAMGLTARRAASTIRVSPGADEPTQTAAPAAAALAAVVERLRALARR